MNAVTMLSSHLADRYAIERAIGAGGMATVYLARDLRHDRRVALKVLKPELGAVLGVERFLSEIRVTANLQHPNLLPLFDSGEANGMLFYVMPFVDGESLRAKLDREKQLPVEEAIRIAVAVASALAYAHTQGVIHRDLKPENILLQSGQPVVADFGIALAVSNAGGARVTQTGLSLGTPQYMSPEQATGDRAIDGRSDIYSLAAMTYEMLTGEPPHTGTTAQAIIARLLTEQPRSVRVTRPNLPVHVEHAVMQALAKLPADRWATAGQFADALQGRLNVAHHAPALAPLAAPRGWRARARDPIVLALLTTSAVFGAWALRSPRVEDEHDVIRTQITPPEGERLLRAQNFAISPDGNTIVYQGINRAGTQLFFVRALSQLTAREMPGTENAGQPFFSPDGEWLAFVAGNQLKKVHLANGTVITLTQVGVLGATQGAGWAGNDVMVLPIGRRLHKISANGGAPEPWLALDTASGERAHRAVRVLPDGETVLFLSWHGALSDSRLGIASLATGKATRLELSDASPVGLIEGKLLYATSAGVLMAVPFDLKSQQVTGSPVMVIDEVFVTRPGAVSAQVSSSGSLIYRSGISKAQIAINDRNGNASVLIPEAKDYSAPRLSPDGKRVAFAVAAGGTVDIVIYEIASKTFTKLTTEGTQNIWPEWTPDGKRILFVSNRAGTNALWWQPADLSGSAELVESSKSGTVDEGVISPNGEYLVFRRGSPGQDLWYRRLSGDTSAKPLAADNRTIEQAPRFSLDGKWIAYLAGVAGEAQVFVQPFPPVGARYPVSAARAGAPVWSRDGSRIYYSRGGQLEAANITITPTFAVTSRATLFEESSLNVPVHANYDVTREGGILWLRSLTDSSPLVVVHNWKYELRQRMSQ